MKETIAKVNKAKTINKPLAREKNQVNKIRNESGEITTDNTNTKNHKRVLPATICQ